MNIFEIATRKAFRFQSPKGLLTVEDLWNLPLSKGTANLNDIAISINRRIKASAEESFVAAAGQKRVDSDDVLMLEILKHIISVRQAEDEARTTANAKAEQRRKLQELIDRKKEGELEGKSIEELQQMMDSM